MKMIHLVVHFFDKLEDGIRAHLSRFPVPYSIISGIAIVLFWRGVWHLADDLGLSSINSILISLPMLLLTGVLVSYFVADRVILSGLKHEEKLVQKTADELKAEDNLLHTVAEQVKNLSKEVKRMDAKIQEEIEEHHH